MPGLFLYIYKRHTKPILWTIEAMHKTNDNVLIDIIRLIGKVMVLNNYEGGQHEPLYSGKSAL